jgi:PPIC-type PPIASE domain
MKLISALGILILGAISANAQKLSIAEMKTEIEKAANSPLYVKDVLKKKFKIDTIIVTRTSQFRSLADSLAYKGQIKKVYGPYSDPKNGRFLVQILAKAPNTFFHLSQVFLDTSVFSRKFADSLANSIVDKVNSGKTSFASMAASYSMGGESQTQGDLGWVAQGILLPAIERELVKRKKGEVFKVWSPNGVHIIMKTDEPKKDSGFVLAMRVFL